MDRIVIIHAGEHMKAALVISTLETLSRALSVAFHQGR